MKVIVNRNQYEKVIKESRGYSKSVEKWGDYVTDELLPLVLKQEVEEDVYLLKKLSLKLKGKDFENIKNKVYEHINNGTSVFAYANHGISGTTGRIRTGLFKIAKKLNITITQIAIDNINSLFNCIPYQRFEIRIGETFYVDDPIGDAMKTHRFFSKSYKLFQKKPTPLPYQSANKKENQNMSPIDLALHSK